MLLNKYIFFDNNGLIIVFKKDTVGNGFFCLLPTAIELSCIDFTDYHISNFL